MQAAKAVHKAKSIKSKVSKGLDDATTRSRSKSTSEKKGEDDIESGKPQRKATITGKSAEGRPSSKSAGEARPSAKSEESKKSTTSTEKKESTPDASGSVGQVENMIYLFIARDNEMTVYS